MAESTKPATCPECGGKSTRGRGYAHVAMPDGKECPNRKSAVPKSVTVEAIIGMLETMPILDRVSLKTALDGSLKGKEKQVKEMRDFPPAGYLWILTFQTRSDTMLDTKVRYPVMAAEPKYIRYRQGKIVAGLHDRWTKLRTETAVDEKDPIKKLAFASFRDGAQTAAIENGADPIQVDFLLGHRASGVRDNYLMRRPSMVAGCCEAIGKYYGTI